MSSSSPAATSTSSNNTSSNQQGDVCLYVRRRDFQQIEKMLKQNPQKLTKQIRWVINTSGVGPLHRAASNGDNEMLQVLFTNDQQLNPNQRTTWGWYTPLHLACKFGHEKTIFFLLDHGAKWNIKDKYQKTPLQWAIRAGHAAMAYRIDQIVFSQEKQQQKTIKQIDNTISTPW